MACAVCLCVSKAFSQSLSDAEPKARRQAARSLAESRADKDIRAVRSALRREKDPLTRAVLVGVLGRMRPDASVLPELKKAAKDGSAVVRLEAVAALGRVPGDAATKILTERVAADPDAEVRQMAAMRLAGRAGAVDALAGAAEGDLDPGVRAQAVHALADDESPRARQAVTKAKGDAHPEVKRMAKTAEGR